MPGQLMERESETGLAGEAGFEVIDALVVTGVLRLHASGTADFFFRAAISECVYFDRRCVRPEHTRRDRREAADPLAGAGLNEHRAGSGEARDRVVDARTLGLIRVETVVCKCGRRSEQQYCSGSETGKEPSNHFYSPQIDDGYRPMVSQRQWARRERNSGRSAKPPVVRAKKTLEG
jgi:CDGSH-type Zn-finger protein